MAENNYAEDAGLLAENTELIELTAGGEARIAVAPQYQGRVMTSTLAGPKGRSFGWVNADFIAAGADDLVFNNYGGEDRFWLGPEAGQFGLWFAPGDPFDLDHWKTPAGLNSGAFEITSRRESSVSLAARFDVTNYAGTTFRCAVKRTNRPEVEADAPDAALGAGDAAAVLGADVPQDAAMVAFESHNVLANVGASAWAPEGGLLSIWILGMFKPLAAGKVIVPFVAGDQASLGPAATTDYFGPIPPDRCRLGSDHLLLACDGRFRSKIGISPARAKNVLGSYDPDAGVLTILQFNLPPNAADLPYVNSLWEIQQRPFAGDAVNSYNDGEPQPGAGQLGPFYEMETSSPAVQLPAGASITHIHRTFHFAAPRDDLAKLARNTLGIDLSEIA